MLSRFKPGVTLLSPLIIRSCQMEYVDRKGQADARVELALPGDENKGFRFAVESKSTGTPLTIQAAVARAKAAAGPDEHAMIQVPYLSPERIEELEADGVSGVDLCGNGVVIVPGRLWIVRSGHPNQYPDSRPLNNPFRGRSAMVARMLLRIPSWPSLTRLVDWVRNDGADLSLAQASKAIRALEEELLVSKVGGTIKLQEPLRLLDKLGSQWRKPAIRAREALRLPKDANLAGKLSSDQSLRWAVTGEASVSQYVVFSQAGPIRIAVSDLQRATRLLGGILEPVPNFADVELLETEEPGFFFQTVTDEKGMRWASRVQAWLELQSGDGRQRDAARDLRSQILTTAQK